MINQTLLWLLILPLIIGLIIFALRRNSAEVIKICGGYTLIAVIVVLIGFFVSTGVQTHDIEIWNGKVVSKERINDHYTKSYDCNCTRDSKGNSSCQTCYEDRYTVEWKCGTTLGEYQLEKLDKSRKSVWDTPDIQRYTVIQKGDPVAKRMSYVNYVQAVPNSLFTPSTGELKAKFKGLLPAYPDNVYDFYKLNRFITPGWAPADAAQWNEAISLGLRELGPKKQVNTIIVIAKTSDPDYEYALRDAWEGVNKNDVVLLIGSAAYPKIDFVRVISWTKSEAFKIELRDAVDAKQTIDRSIVPMMFTQIEKNFERRHMKEFKYLDGEIDPPDWLVWLLIAIVVGGGVVTWVKMDQFSGGFNRRWRK